MAVHLKSPVQLIILRSEESLLDFVQRYVWGGEVCLQAEDGAEDERGQRESVEHVVGCCDVESVDDL